MFDSLEHSVWCERAYNGECGFHCEQMKKLHKDILNEFEHKKFKEKLLG